MKSKYCRLTTFTSKHMLGISLAASDIGQRRYIVEKSQFRTVYIVEIF